MTKGSKSKILISKRGLINNTYKDYSKGLRVISKYGKWFPIIASPRLAGIVADLMGDGNLQGEPKWRLDYTSKSKKELKRFESEVYFLFKIKGKIRDCKTNKFGKTFNYG